jgi:hypothetical protein
MPEKWAWEGDGDEREGFEDRSAAIKNAAAHFQLSIAEVHELSKNGIISLGQYTCLKVRPANDTEEWTK